MITVETPATAANGPGAWTIPWKGTDMSDRTGVCEDCSTQFAVPGVRGPVPKRCPTCSNAQRREYEKAWSAARPPRARTEHSLVCRDCGTGFLWALRGPLPSRCKPCVKARRLAAARERGRIRRLAKKTGDTRRLGVCSECFGEFEGPPRGSIPQRCPACTEVWNKGRYKETPGRSATGRRLHLLTKYGMTQGDWDSLYTAQVGRCAICKRPEDEVGRLHVDHCHSSGVVRGLLCQGCNTSIGKMREDPVIIRAAADYVERHSTP